MLLFVQMVQISRARTTFESMRGFGETSVSPGGALTASLTTGSTSLEGGQVTSHGAGPGHHSGHGHGHGHKHGKGCFGQWKKLLGLDTFIATAQGSHGTRQRQNPFSRGILSNCRDFWLDPAPYFGQRETGAAILDGEPVNYAKMYDLPLRARIRSGEGGGVYHNVSGDDVV